MFRKNYFIFLLATVLFSLSGLAVFAQTAPVAGKVVLKKADGTTEPVAGALVEVFRTDIKGTLPSDKTNKKGEFAFAGLPLGATFVLSISAPNAKPGYYPNVKAGNDKLLITIVEGDGKRWTEQEIRQVLAEGATTAATPTKSAQSSEEQKKAQAEYEKQVAEVTAKNENVKQKTAVIEAALKAGNEAFNSKNYDVAIAKFNEGYEADTEFVGSAPVLLNNKGASLTSRAVNTFNQSVKAETAVRLEGYGKVKKDLGDAADAYNRSWTILKNAPATDAAAAKSLEANKMNALRGIKETFRLMAATEQVDATKAEIGKTLIPEYVNIETDAVKKSEAQVTLGDVFRVAGDFDNAIAEYRKALELSKDNPDALAGLGLSLFAAGEATNDTAKKQEGLNYMQRFSEVAPAGHKLKDDVTSVVEYLKTQKLAPQKVTTTKKKN